MRPTPPPAFDPATYLAENPDLGALDDAAAVDHYAREGRIAGRVASPAARREGLLELIRTAPSILEIGPFCSPLLNGPHVEYLDVLTAEQLRERASGIGIDPAGCPETIHHVGDLAQVDRRYAAVVSSHAIEHQPDLVRHLREVARILEPDGAFYLLIPDKRFCFDHFIGESTIADVLQAHHERRRVHSLASVIEHGSLTTHNDPGRHWQGDSADRHADKLIERVRLSLRRHADSSGGYVDVHAWYFTPASFRAIVDALAALELIDLDVAEVYDTVHGRNEFAAVLRLNPPAADRARNAPIAASADQAGASPALIAAPTPAPRLDLAAQVIVGWRSTGTVPAHRRALADALEAGDAALVAGMLAGLGADPSGQGLFGGAQQHHRARDPIFAARRAQETADAIAALTTAVGAVPGSTAANWRTIATATGIIPSSPPHVGGHLGIDTGEGQIVHLRMVEALHAAWRLRQIAADGDRIVEIGGGAGLIAWYARQLGLTGVLTADHPIEAAIKTYLLEGSGAVDLAALPEQADILFNHEALPPGASLATLLTTLRPRQLLLLRQPAAATVALAEQAIAAGYHLRHRQPDWLRADHQELLFDRLSPSPQ